MGFPIRTSADRSLLSGYPRHFAACSVLLRLSEPRHPPSALSSLSAHTGTPVWPSANPKRWFLVSSATTEARNPMLLPDPSRFSQSSTAPGSDAAHGTAVHRSFLQRVRANRPVQETGRQEEPCQVGCMARPTKTVWAFTLRCRRAWVDSPSNRNFPVKGKSLERR